MEYEVIEQGYEKRNKNWKERAILLLSLFLFRTNFFVFILFCCNLFFLPLLFPRFLRFYGVEVARALLIREIAGVFNAYNIRVNRRHLDLVADHMSFEGEKEKEQCERGGNQLFRRKILARL